MAVLCGRLWRNIWLCTRSLPVAVRGVCGLHGCALCYLSLLCGSVWWLLCLPTPCLLHVLHAAVTDWEGGGSLSTFAAAAPNTNGEGACCCRTAACLCALIVESPTNAIVPFCDGCHCSAGFALPRCVCCYGHHAVCLPSVMPSCRRCLRDQAQRPAGEREPVSAAQPRRRRGGLRVWQASLSMYSTLRCAAVCRMHPSNRRVVDACMCWALRKCRC